MNVRLACIVIDSVERRYDMQDGAQNESRDADKPDHDAEETRRHFVRRARAAGAVPAIVALSMIWTNNAKGC